MIGKMLARGIAAVAVTSLFFLSVGANAIEISVVPATQMVKPGDAVVTDVNISGLGDGVAPSVSVFDIDVDFDTSLLNLTSVVFGSGLDLGFFGSFQDVSGVGPVNVFELSFESVADLDNFQPDAFTLFTMAFDALAPGTSSIGLTLKDLGDSLGDPLAADVVGGAVTVARGSANEPATLALLGLGVAGIGYGRRKRIRDRRRFLPRPSPP